MRLHRVGVHKHAKLGEKGVFLVILTNFGKDMTDKLRKTHAKTCIKGLFSYLNDTCLGCGLKSFCEDDIQQGGIKLLFPQEQDFSQYFLNVTDLNRVFLNPVK